MCGYIEGCREYHGQTQKSSEVKEDPYINTSLSIDYRKKKNTAVFWSDYERRQQMSLTVLRSKRKIPGNRRVGKARIS